MKRRYFLLAGLAALGSALGLRFALSKNESAIEKVLYKKKLNYLKLDHSGVRHFAQDLAARHVISSSRLLVIDAAGPLYTRIALSAGNKLGREILHGEEPSQYCT